jgi:hypothetical protein
MYLLLYINFNYVSIENKNFWIKFLYLGVFIVLLLCYNQFAIDYVKLIFEVRDTIKWFPVSEKRKE